MHQKLRLVKRPFKSRPRQCVGPLPRRKSEVLKKLKDWACKYNIMPQLSQYWMWSFKFRDTKLGILCLKVNRFEKVFDVFWHGIIRSRQKFAYLERINFFINWSINFDFIPIPIICSNWRFDFWNKIPRTISFQSLILCVKVFSIGASFKSFGAL